MFSDCAAEQHSSPVRLFIAVCTKQYILPWKKHTVVQLPIALRFSLNNDLVGINSCGEDQFLCLDIAGMPKNCVVQEQ